ncbi:TPA: D-2-hydroxyacid dehydrogenase [Pseudomonas putida]|uniref:D-2-hydroxyacid dehydrogenase n=1 Tax=Pseudomonas TaxID=286 RepID=UPI0007614948|nr:MULTISPECIES: D-2-hydroxyacid dehydrogenase [Pseudomonas]ANI34704.1 2-hydroxyacid dehydrogenase [Pseudomonas sp. JY-Q]MCE0906017.1 D-2-hydroxyacid dehydrogenase [Pseudomonas alloputida]MDD2023551.1 D-2-hydroxyacid dehydrogenase [Pseudomonas putida]MDN5518606.1 D-2-hydroxyacid dehydrogenase [Pseudomonas sp.]MDN5530424.1 D-2-hydroxyacid dehydrogenase [Pseudomonas sp.]
MNIVLLDGASLPSPLARPLEATEWSEREKTPLDQLVEALAEADVAITNKVRIDRLALEQLPKLKLICVAATGYDCVDIAACRDQGVTVCNVPAYSAVSVAEHVMCSLFALRRQLLAYRTASASEWPASSHFCVHGEPIQDLQGSTLGIIGRGDIGSRVARLARALEINVLFAEHRGAHKVREGYSEFDEVLARSDALTLHCPLTPQTRYLIGSAQIARMKPGAVLINTARGPLIDENAVLAGLANGQLGGAALDVLYAEPPRPDHPLLHCTHPNLIITPHVAWASQSSVARLKSVLAANITAFAKGDPINVVT